MNFQIIGFNFTKISGERYVSPKESRDPKERKITTNILFTDIDKEKILVLKEEAVKISFKFSVAYEPKRADLVLEGVILLKANQDDMKEVLKEWKKKKLPDELHLPLFNLILNKCTLKALQMEEELDLPTHIPLPKVSRNQPNK